MQLDGWHAFPAISPLLIDMILPLGVSIDHKEAASGRITLRDCRKRLQFEQFCFVAWLYALPTSSLSLWTTDTNGNGLGLMADSVDGSGHFLNGLVEDSEDVRNAGLGSTN